MKGKIGFASLLAGLWIAGLWAVPGQAWAHEMEDASSRGTIGWRTVLFISAFAALALFVVLHILASGKLASVRESSRQADKAQRQRFARIARQLRTGWMLSAAALLVISLANLADSRRESSSVSVQHIHGIGYSADGRQILFASHEGIKTYYADGHWVNGPGDKNDYMGFSAVDDGFYASGHPGQSSSLKNPLGIVASGDDGRSIRTGPLYGLMDFHVMTASFAAHTLYVINPAANPLMQETGLYYSTDDGKSWTRSGATGLNGMPSLIAAHPERGNELVVGTDAGLFRSSDYGDTFSPVISDRQITAAAYGADGTLCVGTYATAAGWVQVSEDGTMKEWSLPALSGQDAVAYMAQKPGDSSQWVMATYRNEGYVTDNDGADWTRIMKDGEALSAR